MEMKVMHVWDSITDTRFKENRRTINISELFYIIRGDEYRLIIEKIRSESDDNKRKSLKELLPAVTISGTFSERKNACLLRHSHYLCMDFDKLGSQKQSYKDKLKEDKYVYGYFTSASGNGLAVIVKIDPLRHQETFDALSKYFYNQYGLVADIGCKDVSRLRFFSHDPDAHTYYQAQAFDKFPKADKHPKKHYVSVPATNSDIGKIVNQAMQRGCDITDGSYFEWMRLAASLVTLGEQGRPYFHILSQYSPKYNHSQCDRMFSNMQRSGNGSITIGTFYYFAKRAGLETNTEKQVKIIETCREVKQITKLTVDNAIKRLQDKHIICTDEDEAVNNEDIELVKTVYESTDIAEVIGIQEIENHILENYEFRRNEITNQIEWKNGGCLEDTDFAEIYIETKKQYPKINKNDIVDIIHAKAQTYNPLKDFIEKNRELITNGTTKGLIEKLAITICSDSGINNDVFDVEYEYHYIKKWMVGMIASIYGHTSPLLLALVGSQNTGKTFWFRHLLPDVLKKYMAQIKLSIEKDAEIAMTKYLMILDDELAGKTKMEEKHLKELTSKSMFTFRPPYGRVSIQRPRLAVLCGTSNEEQILSDPTGNRRIIPIHVISINHELYNSIDKTALFMEAVRLYESGEKWELSNEEIQRLEKNTVNYVAENYERELIEQYFEMPTEYNISFAKFFTTTNIKDFIETKIKDKLNIRKVGMELRIMKFERTAKKINNITKYGYMVITKNTEHMSY